MTTVFYITMSEKMKIEDYIEYKDNGVNKKEVELGYHPNHGRK